MTEVAATSRGARLRRLLDRPKTWLVLAAAFLVLGLLTVPHRAFWDGEWAAASYQWEGAGPIYLVLLVCLVAAGVRWLEAHPPPWLERATERAGTLPPWAFPVAVGVTWTIGWLIFHRIEDPDWIASGVDWHDSLLGAYSFIHDDPGYYSAWRLPLYPWMVHVLAGVPGISLEVSGQLIGRVSSILLAWPMWVIARELWGRHTGAATLALLCAFVTYRVATDSYTPYPVYMLLNASAVAFTIKATRGGVLPFAGAAVSIALAFAADNRALIPALGFYTLLLPLALFAPWRWDTGPSTRGRAFRLTRQLALAGTRLALLWIPLVVSYNWMHDLPVKAITLEDQAANYLVAGETSANLTNVHFDKGFRWGHFDDHLTIPRTLMTFLIAGQRPEMQAEQAKRAQNSWLRVKRDYPGSTWRLMAFTLAGLLVSLLLPLRRSGDGSGWRWVFRERLIALVQVGAIVVVLASCYPNLLRDYRERYLLHGAVLMPLLFMGTIEGLARLGLGRSDEGLRRSGRALIATLAVLGTLFWTGNPMRLASVRGRINPVAMGGLQEVQVAAWGRENLGPNDFLLDSSWMMTSLILIGEVPLARPHDLYPPPGAPVSDKVLRVTRPWPATLDGDFYALVQYLPPDFKEAGENYRRPAPWELDLPPDTFWGKRILAMGPVWEKVFQTEDQFVHIYRYTGRGIPRGWRLPGPLRKAVPRRD